MSALSLHPLRSSLISLTFALGLFTTMGGTTAALPPQPFPCPVWPPADWCPIIIGIDGGGVVETEFGQADFAVFATHVQPGNGQDEQLTLGQIQWVDPNSGPAGVTFTSVRIDAYGAIDGIEGGRFVRGLVSVNGEEELPFELLAVDGGPPSSGADTIELAVGNQVAGQEGNAFGYHAKGPLASGDLQLLNFVPADGTPDAPAEENDPYGSTMARQR